MSGPIEKLRETIKAIEHFHSVLTTRHEPDICPRCQVEALLPALEQREKDIQHAVVAKINKLLGIQSNVDLERWEQLKEHIVGLEQQISALQNEIELVKQCWAKYIGIMRQERAALQAVTQAVVAQARLEEHLALCTYCSDSVKRFCDRGAELRAALNPTEKT